MHHITRKNYDKWFRIKKYIKFKMQVSAYDVAGT